MIANKDLREFIENFDIADNALQMRCMMRWNGRDLRERENLSEHTHLVVACAIKLHDYFVERSELYKMNCDFEYMIRLAMLHDSLEMLRGDILSVTKDSIEGLRAQVDKEEYFFQHEMLNCYNVPAREVVYLADLMACYKFVEHELRYPSNDFSLKVYKETKKRFDDAYGEFCRWYEIDQAPEAVVENEFFKGYEADAGVDIVLKENITFMPMTSMCVGMKVQVTPKEGEMSFLCSRTSAAQKGIIVAMCPIDPNYTGEVTAIVHNVSNSIVEYKKGDAFCQVVTVPFNNFPNGNCQVKKDGKRSDGKLGSTGGAAC